MNPKKNYDWIPPKFWTAPIDTNIFKMFMLKFQGVHNKVYECFKSRALLEEEVQELTLESLDGRKIDLRGFIGRKHIVLEFGAIT